MNQNAMEDHEPLWVDCGRHGKRVSSVVCRHQITSSDPVGFVEIRSEPNDLQAWCESCEQLFLAEGDMTEKFRTYNDMAIVCCVCYAALKQKHSNNTTD